MEWSIPQPTPWSISRPLVHSPSLQFSSWPVTNLLLFSQYLPLSSCFHITGGMFQLYTVELYHFYPFFLVQVVYFSLCKAKLYHFYLFSPVQVVYFSLCKAELYHFYPFSLVQVVGSRLYTAKFYHFYLFFLVQVVCSRLYTTKLYHLFIIFLVQVVKLGFLHIHRVHIIKCHCSVLTSVPPQFCSHEA